MAPARRYRLLCPVARALDRVGDRWTLLILRDLHAGPARFSDLQSGLKGIATNLLTERLNQLIADGLAEKRAGAFGATVYALTALGERTRTLLFELALFGGRFAPDAPVRRPGNLRTIAVTLGAALERVAEPTMAFRAALTVDGEDFALDVNNGKVNLQTGAVEDPDVTFKTEYEPMIAVSEGEMPVEEFLAEHVDLSATDGGQQQAFMTLFGAVLELFRAAAQDERQRGDMTASD